MSRMSFAHLVRAVLVAVGLLLAVMQIKVLVSEPNAPFLRDAILPVVTVAR